MKKVLVFSVAVLAIAGFATASDVANTKHNLSSTAGATTSDYYVSDTDEVCVFCHTPHSAASNVPLWNRGATSGTGWTMYSSTTLNMADGVTAPLGVSAACMSCHDGTSGLDVLINAPGSDGYNAGGATQGWTWTAGSNTLAGAGVTNLGTDLSGEHPISFQYVGSGGEDPDFVDATGTKVGQLPLYNTGGGSNWIECGTCHNPHDNQYGTFLRISNAGSVLCTTCHTK